MSERNRKTFNTPRKKKKTGHQCIEQYIDEQVQLKMEEIEKMKKEITRTYKYYQRILNNLVTKINESKDLRWSQSYIGEYNKMEHDPIYLIVRKDFLKQMTEEGFTAIIEFFEKEDKNAIGLDSGFNHYIKLTLN